MFRDHTLIQTFTIPVQVTTVTNELMKGSEKFVKQQVELVDPSFTLQNSRIEPLEFLFVNLPLTPHWIGISQEIILISNTLHVTKVFITPIMTFEETFDRQRTIVMTGLQILNQVEFVEEASAELVKGAINQPVAEDQANLGL